jgi:uncharacterized protein (TIGR03435 family)
MRRAFVRTRYFVFACSFTFGQVSPVQPRFEVAAVKSVDPNSGAPGSNVMRGGPGTDDPARITFSSVTMKRLLMAAYRVDEEQISGPDWLDSQRYAVTAKVPAGSTKEQLLIMLQGLLAERFHLTLHQEMKEFPAYELGDREKWTETEASGSRSRRFTARTIARPLLRRESRAWRRSCDIQHVHYFGLG